MSKVSTRPRTAATPVAATATAVTDNPSPLPAPEDWRPAAIAARDAISQLVFEAQRLDENERDDACGFAKRLMVMAVSEIGETNSSAPQHEFEEAVFNAEALINGALDLSADRAGPNAVAHLRHALVILDKLTDTISGGMDVGPVWSAIRSKPTNPQKAPAVRAGLTVVQLEHVLETVAGRTRTLQQVLMMLQGTSIEDEYHRSVCIDAAEAMATAIGAMADEATGGGVIGDADSWQYGPNFADEGKAVQA